MTTRTKCRAALTVTLAVASTTAAWAQTQVQARGKPSGTDQQIVAQLHLANQLAIEKADLGQTRANDPRVEAFAEALEQDHRVADMKLFTYAQAKNMNMDFVGRPGANLPAHDALATADLTTVTPAGFDHRFASEMVADQQSVIDEIQLARQMASDPELRLLVEGMLPRLQINVATAQQLVNRLPEPVPTLEMVPPAGPPPPANP